MNWVPRETSVSKMVSPARITLEEVRSTLKSVLPDLKRHYGVETLGVFGSYARGESKRTSDLDLLVEFGQAPTMFECMRLEHHLATILGVKVDLVMKTALKPEIGRRILAEVVGV